MMIHLDLKLLTALLGVAEPRDTSIPEGVNRYLAELLLFSSDEEETVYIGNIDFDAFEERDLPAFEMYCDKISAINHRVRQVDSSMVRIAPIPLHHRQFC